MKADAVLIAIIKFYRDELKVSETELGMSPQLPLKGRSQSQDSGTKSKPKSRPVVKMHPKLTPRAKPASSNGSKTESKTRSDNSRIPDCSEMPAAKVIRVGLVGSWGVPR